MLSRVSRLARHLDRARRAAFTGHDLEIWEFDVLSALRRQGAPYQLTPGALAAGREILPECWQQQDPIAAQAATAMGAGLSQLFDDYQVIRAGSLIGVNLRFNAVLAAGNATARVTVNGVATALIVTVASPASSGRAVVAPETITYAAGDLIGVTLETSAGYLPVTLDAEASVEVDAT